MKCKNLSKEGRCFKNIIPCDFFGINAEFVPACPYNGDVQKCLDNIVQAIESKKLKPLRRLTAKEIMAMFGIIE